MNALIRVSAVCCVMILLTFLINLTSEQQHLKLLHTCLTHDWYVTGGKLSGMVMVVIWECSRLHLMTKRRRRTSVLLSCKTGMAMGTNGPGTMNMMEKCGSVQGLHNLHGSFNVAGTLGSQNPTTANVPSSGLQQQSGNLSAGRFTSNNMPAALSQIAHGNSLSHSGLNSRGSLIVVGTPGFSSGANAFSGSIPGVLPTTAPISNRNSIPGVGVPPVIGNRSSRITS
ncbi:hypothetical protein HanRHA438_Chr10g0447601 [Helianthus annuus]|uniref:Uncharacterized protein n=1 Tax=Helianthus annuus TaxID=4232 RepID=A0A9K3GTX3_HELAN|nr:hypothetical protein HanXRQr2_Chr17g0804711 [Helianthus annuus]KAF5786003.1 hypothetical protein HanXRQr2_Chr10g0435491 [Helianthus annuus]KAJ0429394.1 hypothetical protein HanHA300_Chr17g0656771 [Helianthus annuus]KAJ0636439.1 hypothetical protein HanOQP8_Chr17g0661891 [Helianthus annuus]KAJ0696467.1 hypothetical protein HanLR1_Chr10g0357451 [Helianthus annuus]